MSRPKAFVILFKDLHVWSVGSFFKLNWQWPIEYIKPLSSVLKRKSNVANNEDYLSGQMKLVTLHFDGTVVPRATNGKNDFKGNLYSAASGDVVYSKIDVRNGAIGIVPEDIVRVAVSSEFPVYEVNPELAFPQYIKLLFRTQYFRQAINSMISGTSGRKRVQPSQLEALEVPLPPLPIQQAIVERWTKAKENIASIEGNISKLEHHTKLNFLQQLGIKVLEDVNLPKCFAVEWKDLERWSVEYLARMIIGLNNNGTGQYKSLPLSRLCSGQSGGTPSKSVSAYWNGELPWVSPKDMKTFEIFDTQDHISEKALNSSSAPLIKPNSILVVVRSGILQRTVPIAINRVPVSINQDMRAFTPVDSRDSAGFSWLLSKYETRRTAQAREMEYNRTEHQQRRNGICSNPCPAN